MTPQDRLIVALDVPSRAAALEAADRLESTVRWLKVGLELYLAEGAPIVETLRERGFKVFLDLKLHDIPNTVAGAVRTAAASGADLLTLHASGGPAMLTAAANAAAALHSPPRLLAVTVLTSMDSTQLQAIGIDSSPATQVALLANMAMQTGVAGLVCSPQEVAALRSGSVNNGLLVVPGIRPAGSTADDQSRFATPADAIRAGADMLVVGRPILRAENPAAAARSLLSEIEAAQQSEDSKPDA